MTDKKSNAFRLGLALALSLSASAAAETFLQKLLRISGISATPSLQKSDEDDMPGGGQIWIAGPPGAARKLTGDSGYRSPIFSPDGRFILAVRSNDIWRVLLAGGSSKKIHTVPNLSKLIGFDSTDTNQLCLLQENEGQATVTILLLTSGLTMPLEYDRQDRQARRMITHLKAWERDYGPLKVYPEKQRKKGLSGDIEWNDVFLKRGDDDPINLSKSDGINCGQPSVSLNGDQVVFIKAISPAE